MSLWFQIKKSVKYKNKIRKNTATRKKYLENKLNKKEGKRLMWFGYYKNFPVKKIISKRTQDQVPTSKISKYTTGDWKLMK